MKMPVILGQPPYCHGANLVKIGRKLKEEFPSCSYLLDMAATAKVARTGMEQR